MVGKKFRISLWTKVLGERLLFVCHCAGRSAGSILRVTCPSRLSAVVMEHEKVTVLAICELSERE